MSGPTQAAVTNRNSSTAATASDPARTAEVAAPKMPTVPAPIGIPPEICRCASAALRHVTSTKQGLATAKKPAVSSNSALRTTSGVVTQVCRAAGRANQQSIMIGRQLSPIRAHAGGLKFCVVYAKQFAQKVSKKRTAPDLKMTSDKLSELINEQKIQFSADQKKELTAMITADDPKKITKLITKLKAEHTKALRKVTELSGQVKQHRAQFNLLIGKAKTVIDQYSKAGDHWNNAIDGKDPQGYQKALEACEELLKGLGATTKNGLKGANSS